MSLSSPTTAVAGFTVETFYADAPNLPITMNMTPDVARLLADVAEGNNVADELVDALRNAAGHPRATIMWRGQQVRHPDGIAYPIVLDGWRINDVAEPGSGVTRIDVLNVLANLCVQLYAWLAAAQSDVGDGGNVDIQELVREAVFLKALATNQIASENGLPGSENINNRAFQHLLAAINKLLPDQWSIGQAITSMGRCVVIELNPFVTRPGENEIWDAS